MPDLAIDWEIEARALQKRFAQVFEGKSKSEIARKTNTSVTNVARYLSGTRMPAEFCAALVKGMGVNPAWLLAGEGTPMVSDITSGTANMGGNLLELVEAMNAVSQMRLGALTGKHHLKVLRELNDALTTYERLRAKLNEHSIPIFRQLLGDLRKSMDKYEMEPAREILKATEQVARLCDDETLKGELIALQAQYHFFMRNHARALEYHRQHLLQPLARGAVLDNSACQTLMRMVLTLVTLHAHEEALAVCESALRLVPVHGRAWDSYPLLAFLQGRLKAELGDLSEGLAIMMREMPPDEDRRSMALRLWLTPHLLRAGLLRPQDAFEFGEHIAPKAIVIMDHACWLEDPGFLKQACDYALSKRFEKMGDMARPGFYGPYLLRALVERDQKAPAAFEAARENCTDEYRENPEVYLAQIWRVLGNRKAALACFETAHKRLAIIPQARHVEVLTRAVHWKNALWLAGHDAGKKLAEAASEARAFFARHVESGFRCFKAEAAAKPLLTTQS